MPSIFWTPRKYRSATNIRSTTKTPSEFSSCRRNADSRARKSVSPGWWLCRGLFDREAGVSHLRCWGAVRAQARLSVPLQADFLFSCQRADRLSPKERLACDAGCVVRPARGVGGVWPSDQVRRREAMALLARKTFPVQHMNSCTFWLEHRWA